METVEALREAIKNKRMVKFYEIDVDTLFFYKASILCNEDLQRQLDSLVFQDEQRLDPWDILSNIFSDV